MTRFPIARNGVRRTLYVLAAVLLLAVAYPASYGPASYCVGRGWLAHTPWIYSPLLTTLKSWPEAERLYYRYFWWGKLGWEHSERTLPPEW